MKINNKKELKRIIKLEKELYFNNNFYQLYLKVVKLHPDYFTWKFVKQMRITSYYYLKRNNNIIHSVLYIMNSRKMNKLARRLGIETGENVFDENVRIFHSNGIVINGNAQIGKNCRLYGNNCIGNNGINNKAPKIGDNVRICVGAKVLGDITIANNITIAAGAVVTKSCLEENAILAGIPAKIIGYNNCDKKYLD